MTWDPRNLGPAKVRPEAALPEPPAPPPRSYELRLADWDDRRLTALTDGTPFHERIPEPGCEEEVPLYSEALQAEIARSLYGELLGRPRELITTVKLKETIIRSTERACGPVEPEPSLARYEWTVPRHVRFEPSIIWGAGGGAGGAASFDKHTEAQGGAGVVGRVSEVLPSDTYKFTIGDKAKADAALRLPLGAEVRQDGELIGHTERCQRGNGGTEVTVKLLPNKTLNDFFRKHIMPAEPIDFGDARSEALRENHRALVERPAQTLRDRADAIQYGLESIDRQNRLLTAGIASFSYMDEQYRGADAD